MASNLQNSDKSMKGMIAVSIVLVILTIVGFTFRFFLPNNVSISDSVKGHVKGC